MKTLNDVKDFYDFKQDKVQNFGFVFEVVDENENASKTVEVHASSLMTAIDRLYSFIGRNFKVVER